MGVRDRVLALDFDAAALVVLRDAEEDAARRSRSTLE